MSIVLCNLQIVVRRRSPLSGQTGWWVRQDSNLQPNDYEPFALTIELRTLRTLDYQLRPLCRTMCSLLLAFFLASTNRDQRLPATGAVDRQSSFIR
jgi:hypothetical protein